MKLLLLNGNTDAAITEKLAVAARAMCGLNMTLAAAAAPRAMVVRRLIIVGMNFILDGFRLQNAGH